MFVNLGFNPLCLGIIKLSLIILVLEVIVSLQLIFWVTFRFISIFRLFVIVVSL